MTEHKEFFLTMCCFMKEHKEFDKIIQKKMIQSHTLEYKIHIHIHKKNQSWGILRIHSDILSEPKLVYWIT